MTAPLRAQPTSRAVRALARVARLLVLVLALQSSGVIHAAVEWVVGQDTCDERCDADDDRGRCPPGCDDCACAHGARPAVAARAQSVLPLRPPTELSFSEVRAPHAAPDPGGFFQPPRA